MMFHHQVKLSAMPVFDLHQTGRELMAQLRHPTSYSQPNLRTQMGERLADVRAEFERRWESFAKELES